MIEKVLKLNNRGEAQLSAWYPATVIKAIYKAYDDHVIQTQAAGEMKPNFKEYFFNEFLKPKLKKYQEGHYYYCHLEMS